MLYLFKQSFKNWIVRIYNLFRMLEGLYCHLLRHNLSLNYFFRRCKILFYDAISCYKMEQICFRKTTAVASSALMIDFPNFRPLCILFRDAFRDKLYYVFPKVLNYSRTRFHLNQLSG